MPQINSEDDNKSVEIIQLNKDQPNDSMEFEDEEDSDDEEQKQQEQLKLNLGNLLGTAPGSEPNEELTITNS